jgi:hypothetical protein
MPQSDEFEIVEATKAHRKAPLSLADSPIILSVPNRQILHFPGIVAPKDSSVCVIESGDKILPRVIKPAIDWTNWGDAWMSRSDHRLLFSLLGKGIIPDGWPEPWGPDEPPKYELALERARSLGYVVPESSDKQLGRGEREAFYASCLVFHGHLDRWIARRLTGWRDNLCQLTGQFIVPDPFESESKWPYVLDQLWIVKGANRSVPKEIKRRI